MTDQAGDRKKSHPLVLKLMQLQGDNVSIRVSNYWMFTGKLASISCDVALLVQVTVTSGSGLTLSTFDVNTVKINLEALTSVGKPILIENGVG